MKKMKRSRKILMLALVLICALPACAWFISESRWRRINNPEGKFSTVSEYLSGTRQPSRVQRIEKDGQNFFIAYGPMDTWLAFPSGPAAYVFGPDRTMVDWSWDTGDDSDFEKQWPRSLRVDATIEEMEKETFQQEN